MQDRPIRGGSTPNALTAAPKALTTAAIGDWVCVILATAVEHDVFIHLASGAHDAATLAGRAALSLRRAQGLLDGLVGIGLVELEAGRYRNSAEAAAWLTGQSLSDLRPLVVQAAQNVDAWQRFAETVKRGKPLVRGEPEQWARAVRAFAPLSIAGARVAAARLAIEDGGPCSMLDIGGGSGAFSAILLALNDQAHARQIDFAPVNAIAREFVMGLGVGDRFDTVDGDLRQTDYGDGDYDLVVLSLVLHFFAPATIAEVLRKAHRALRDGGAVVVSDVMSGDEPSLWASAFGANMMMSTEAGGTYTRAQYQDWLIEAGFAEVTYEPIADMPHALVTSWKRPCSAR